MTDAIKAEFQKRISKVKHKYCGSLDESGFRVGKGCQKWNQGPTTQKYSGLFVVNNLHNEGAYLIDKKSDQTYYHGSFYNNKLEGYAKVIYQDSSVFQGLFKQHKRFGPGIVTYADNTEDVGLWEGSFLRKIMVPIGDNFVPKLGKTKFGKAKILKVREMVPVCDNTSPNQKFIKTLVSEDKEYVLGQLYNNRVRNLESLFFNEPLHNVNFPTQDECTIEIEISREEFEEEALKISEDSLKNSENASKNNSENSSETIISRISESVTKFLGCFCFQNASDRFGELCKHLHEVESKLEKVSTRKKQIEQKLSFCKQCCISQRVEMMNEDNLFQQYNSSFFYQPEKSVDPLPMELELQSYLYSVNTYCDKEIAMEASPRLFTERASTATLPFSPSFYAKTNFSQAFKIPEIVSNILETILDEIQVIDLRPEIKCQCNAMLIENINILEEKFNYLDQEECFYSTIKKILTSQLDLEFKNLPENETKFTKKIVVTDLLAWNNEDIWIEVLKHSFCHRFTENNVNFEVSDLLTGHRENFQSPGIYEIKCRKFLEECAEGKEKEVVTALTAANINPDICDINGNTGVMLATIRDKIHIIAILANCGAKLDAMNDECLTPLVISLLKYLVFKFKVCDWEKAFLEESKDEEDYQKWRALDSFENETENIEADPDLKSLEHIFMITSRTMVVPDVQKQQDYLFKMEYKRVKPPKPKKEKKKGKGKKKKNKKNKKKKNKKKNKGKTTKTSGGKKKKKKKKKSETTVLTTEKEHVETEEEKMAKMFEEKMATIKKTICTLLHYGVDPNLGLIPMKPIFLGIYTDEPEIFSLLLKCNADPNSLNKNNLTCLHIIAALMLTLNKVKMCDLLLRHKANPNLKTNPDHWSQLRKELIGNYSEVCEDEGKNPLHVLCLREDFVDDQDNLFGLIAGLLVLHGCNTDEFYLGHTPLSLAVFKGNVELIKALLRTRRVNPHTELGNGMGNALTVLILNRFTSPLTIEVKEKVVETLFQSGLNPFHKVGSLENSLAFIANEALMKKEDAKLKKKKKGGKKGSKKSKKVTKSTKKATKSTKKSKKKKSKKNRSLSTKSGKKKKKELLEPYIIEAARKFLYRHLQGKAVYFLYLTIKESLIADPIIAALAKFVTVEEALNILEMIFQSGNLSQEEYSQHTVHDLLKFVDVDKDEVKRSKSEVDVSKYMELINKKTFKKTKTDPNRLDLPSPEVDRNIDKYKVCFQCLLGKDKRLLKCPWCELVYFCSEECNARNVNTCKYHPCNVNFYDPLDKSMKSKSQPNRLSILLEMAKKLNREKKVLFQLEELNQIISRLRFISAKRKEEASRLIHLFRKLRADREDFGKMHNILGYKIKVMDDRKFHKMNIHLVNVKEVDLRSASDEVFLAKSAHALLSGVFGADGSVRSLSQASLTINADINDYGPVTLKISRSALRTDTDPGRSSYQSRQRTGKRSIELDDKVKFNSNRFSQIMKTMKIVDKTAKVGDKQYYMELLSRIFADFNLPLLLLPYACYKDGQVYYSMSGNGSAGGSGFYKLNIPS